MKTLAASWISLLAWTMTVRALQPTPAPVLKRQYPDVPLDDGLDWTPQDVSSLSTYYDAVFSTLSAQYPNAGAQLKQGHDSVNSELANLANQVGSSGLGTGATPPLATSGVGPSSGGLSGGSGNGSGGQSNGLGGGLGPSSGSTSSGSASVSGQGSSGSSGSGSNASGTGSGTSDSNSGSASGNGGNTGSNQNSNSGTGTESGPSSGSSSGSGTPSNTRPPPGSKNSAERALAFQPACLALAVLSLGVVAGFANLG